MTKRLTAEEVAALFKSYATGNAGDDFGMGREVAYDDASNIVRGNLVQQWQDEPDAETHAICPWWWVENLGDDSPPQKLRNYRPLKMNPEDSTFSVSMSEPFRWDMWTVAGWIPLVGRVAPISERPRS